MRTLELLYTIAVGLWLYGRFTHFVALVLSANEHTSGPAVPSEESGRASSIVHAAPCLTDEEPELLEFPLVDGWDEDAILTCVAEIEAL